MSEDTKAPNGTDNISNHRARDRKHRTGAALLRHALTALCAVVAVCIVFLEFQEREESQFVLLCRNAVTEPAQALTTLLESEYGDRSNGLSNLLLADADYFTINRIVWSLWEGEDAWILNWSYSSLSNTLAIATIDKVAGCDFNLNVPEEWDNESMLAWLRENAEAVRRIEQSPEYQRIAANALAAAHKHYLTDWP